MCDAGSIQPSYCRLANQPSNRPPIVCDAFNYAMARQGYPTGVMVHRTKVVSTVVVILGAIIDE